jgi:addiction module HigA family antidote
MVKNGLRAIHPGEILREEYLVELNMSPHALAQALRVPATRIHEIINERRSITADTAVRLARFFSTTPEFWMNLQATYDLRKTVSEIGRRVEEEVRPLAIA